MTTKRIDCEINTLVFTLDKLVEDLWFQITDTSEMLELCRPCGMQSSDDGYRASTNEEACIGTGEIVAPRLAIDLRKPVPNQVAKWLRRIARDLTASADQIDLIEDGRDLKAIRKLVKGPQNVIV